MVLILVHYLLILCSIVSVLSDLCPKECDCDMDNGLNRATCVGQNIIAIDIGVPNAVQVYDLRHNAISELDNFCFKEHGYTSIKILNLSYNLMSWIGLHAFSELDGLIHLDLSYNRLRYIPSDLLWDTSNLELLDMSGNIFENVKNEPFLMHTKLQVLNLNNCRIKFLPNRMFSRLPNLRKLDLSENYMATLDVEVLRPLRKLERLQLRNDYWQCNPDFMAIEAWLMWKQINNDSPCTKRPQMFERMVSVAAPTTVRADVEVERVWNVTNNNESTPEITTKKSMTPFERFDKDFPAFQALLLGLEIGLAIGIVGTYVWLRRVCSCGRLGCARPQAGRRRRRAGRAGRAADNDMRASLLWTTVINPDLDTPPSFRRLLPDGNAQFTAYGLPSATTHTIQADAIRQPDRAETPPPPYNECRLSI